MNDYNDGIIPEPCLRLDFGFGQEYASVELGDGTGYVRVTEDMRSTKQQRDVELEAALDENAKLRELVRDMCVWAYIDSNCDLEDRFFDRMRELGIEVD